MRARLAALPAALVRARDGSVAILGGLLLVALVGFGALVVDLGNAYLLKRRLQAAIDLAAIAAASDLARPRPAAGATLARNGFADGDITVLELGRYRPDPTLAPAQRFVAGAADPNAVRVRARRVAPIYLARVLQASGGAQAGTGTSSGASSSTSSGDQPPGIALAAEAVAARADLAAFEIGSRLASLDGGLANAVLGALLDARLSLSAMDYRALAAARVDLAGYAGALASRVGLTAGTYDDLLATDVRTSDALAALADAARAAPSSADSTALAALAAIGAARTDRTSRTKLGALLDFGPGGATPIGQRPRVGASVSALDAVSAVAQAANGARMVEVSLDGALPAGIARATLRLAIGERPVGTGPVAVGSPGARASTAQTRLALDLTLVGAPPASLVTVPMGLQLAPATATLTAIACDPADASRATVTLAVQPGLVDAWVGTLASSALSDFSTLPNPTPAPLLSLPPLPVVSARGRATVAQTSPQSVVFTPADIAAATRRTVSTRTPATSLFGSLTRSLSVSVGGGGLGVPLGLDGAVLAVLGAAAPAVDGLVDGLTDLLGLRVGEADVWVTGARCGGAVLVR